MIIHIINYGLGNIASVSNMIRKCGGKAKVCSTKDAILAADRLILPGVGSFDHGIENLHKLKLFTAILEKAGSGTLLLGICLGMQLLSKRSDEGSLNGLGLIDAEFKRFAFDSNSPYRVPHVGWNQVIVEKDNPLIDNDGNEQRFYFTHSYHAVCNKQADVLLSTEYGYKFTSGYSCNNVYGVQFHPEKSHRFGMAMFRKFMEL